MALNHHSAAVLPYFLDEKWKLHLYLEQKGPQYFTPFFDNGLNFMGGNWLAKDTLIDGKMILADGSPRETLAREVGEEFYLRSEVEDSLDQLLGSGTLSQEKTEAIRKTHTPENLARVKNAGMIILDSVRYADSFVMTMQPPFRKDRLDYGSSIYLRELSLGEFQTLEALLADLDGIVSTDNIKHGSRQALVTLDEINEKNMKFAWGYDQVLNALFSNYKLPLPNTILREFTLANIRGISSYRNEEGERTYFLSNAKGDRGDLWGSFEPLSYRDLRKWFDYK